MRYLLCLLLLLSFSIRSQISLPKLVSDGAVLQRDQPLKLWGYASPNERISITLDGKKLRTRANEKGDWSLMMPPHPAGGPFEMVLQGKNELRLKDLLFGDVWLCTGQSNMVLNMERVKEKYPDDITSANYPEIRNFFIRTMTDLQGPRSDFPDGKWEAASPEKVLGFGAVTYFFAREIYQRYRIPIGIINASVGGTPIQAWISESGLQEFPDLQEMITRNKDEDYIAERKKEDRSRTIVRPNNDLGLMENPKWYEEDYQPKGWQNIHIPGFWEDQGLGNLDGVVWYRRELDVPADLCKSDVRLFMGRIVDADHIYVNGQLVGNITYQYPPRRYIIPQGVLKPGSNTIVIRVQNQGNKGGFVPDKPYYLTANGKDIDLKGDWQYKVGQVYEPIARFNRFSEQDQPASLFNAMTAPIVAQTAIKGVLWYQGESNTGNPGPYANYLKALIRDYRKLWDAPPLPFLYVQLANFMDQDFLPVESNWAELRNAQLQVLELPNTAMAVAIDLGEWNDIHPLNKKDVGLRLALGARALAYGERDLAYSGPVYKSFEKRGSKMILHFDHTYGGLKRIDGEPLSQFAIAGEDRKFVWAKAEIVGNSVEVYADEIDDPRYVRYAWSNNPHGANLYNGAGLPASPFEAGERVSPPRANARFSQAARDSIARLSAADHEQMKQQLGISVPNRRGPSGNPQASNAANRDESKVNEYVLPDPLILKNGKAVLSAGDWWEKRRPEIVEDFDREIYGRLPENIPPVNWKIISEKDTLIGSYPIKEKTLRGIVDNSAYPEIEVEIELLVATPADSKGAVPVVMEFGFIRSPFGNRAVSPAGLGSPAEPNWKEQLISRGWGYAIIVPSSIQADNGAGLREGIIGLVNKGQPRKPDDWGSLRAWAWGASRAIDYFETDPHVDAQRIAIEGLSRYGKATIVAMAYEPRFSLAFVGSSGAGGTKILRRVFGEQVENLASTGEYHWFCGNFIKYASTLTPDDMPVDAHELVALCAPRPVFISSGSPQVEGQWVDAKGMFLGGVHAGPVYKLLGKKDLGTSEFPALGTPLVNGDIAFRQHAGGHSTGPNWSTWIAWASRYWEDGK